MKKAINILSLLFLVAGILFKAMYWNGATILLVLGCRLVLLQCVLVIFQAKNEATAFVRYLGSSLLFLTMLGVMFKAQHWPGGTYICGIAIALGIAAYALALRSKEELKIPHQMVFPAIQIMMYALAVWCWQPVP